MENISTYVIEDNTAIFTTSLRNKRNNYVLICIDYIGFYVPRIWLYKFNYLYNILENSDFMIELHKVTDDGIHYIDLTKDFTDTVEINKIDFRDFKYLFYDVLSGKRNCQSSNIKHVLEFFNFMGLERELYNNLKQFNNC